MAPKASVQEASPSPPPLPPGPLPNATTSATVANEAQVGDVPIESLGDDSADEDEEEDGSGAGPSGVTQDDEDEEWDPAEERLPGQSNKDKGKGKETNNDANSQPWQAVWAAEQSAWYFWNAETGQVTWTNPLEPAPPLPTEPAPPAPINPPLPKEAPPLPEPNFGQIPDIDPDLAYLLPATQRGSDGNGQNASFNARTGKFQADGGYAFDHLDEYNRAKRMAGKYFDVDSWEKNLREENAKRKRDEALGLTEEKKITKKDMERFKKKKAEQKWKKQAWLRD